MQKVIFIVGPTATGKTDLALSIASKLNGDIVSADSVQVYKKLDIISGKDLPSNYKFKNGYYYRYLSPSIYLLDVIEPTFSFNVSDFYKLASDSINKIQEAGRLPIVVGGTGLYVEALLNGLNKTVEPDLKLRKQLERLDIDGLHKLIPVEILSKLNASDINNPRRLVRLIERAKSKNQKVKSSRINFEKLVIGLFCSPEVLKKRIDERVGKRLESGALEEAKNLFKNYKKLTQQVKDANGYKQLFMLLNNEIDMDEAIYRWNISEYHHAKNQMTWFRKYGGVEWFDIEKENFKSEIEKRVKDFLL